MKSRVGIILGIVVLCSLVAVAYFRSGLLSLPPVPESVNAHAAGLEQLEVMKSTDESIASEVTAPDPLVARVQSALKEIRSGNEEQGFHAIQEIVRSNPANLVVGNVLRMEALRLKQKWLASNADKSEIALVFPEYLNDEPIRFYRGLAKSNPGREVKLQLALSLVDHMLLFPALEIKAPSSVEAVEILTDVIEHGNSDGAYYVPALYARGLNYLYRPFNLVWPEKIAAPRDAASHDISLAVAIGQKIGSGSDHLKAQLSLTLGDAYAKEGKLGLARSWWQIANNMVHDEQFRQKVFARLQWSDDDVSANLEETFEGQMNDLEHPLSDLRFMWQ
jgi:hypothetical protein